MEHLGYVPSVLEFLDMKHVPPSSLTTIDLEKFGRLGIGFELLMRAEVKRVADLEARREFGLGGNGDCSGILFPYLDSEGVRRTCRLRRDNHEIENGKPVRKYLAPFGDRRHLYIVPGDHALGQDQNIPVVIVEAEKSALALRAWADRLGRQLLPIATGGCWAWRGRIGKLENSNGERVDEVGPLPELGICSNGRKVFVLLDANCSSNSKVRAARNALVRQLLKQKSEVYVVDLPIAEGVNGPDDFIGLYGDEAMRHLLDNALSKPTNWRQGLIYHNLKGIPERVLANVLLALRSAPEWEGVLGFNEFSQQVVSLKPTPWGKPSDTAWTDCDDSLAAEWIQREAGIFVPSSTVAEAVQTVARENMFHPIREYLETLFWDGVQRINHLINTYFGGGDSEFERAVGSRWLISAVARIFRPGCQVDFVLLLEGAQGIKKSSALRALVGEDWFSDHISDLGSKDARVDLLGKWVVEMSELAAMRRAETEKVKAFLTARVDHFRPPYGRRAVDIPRQNIFAASTNDEQPFIDPTGNRRFWPVCCGNIDLEAIHRDRDQLWAEAYHRFKQGEPWWLDTPELNRLAKEQQEQRYEDGVWDGFILPWLENPCRNGDTVSVGPWDGSTAEKVSINDILIHAIGKSTDRLTQADRNQVVRCLIHHGWKKKQERAGACRGKRYYLRPTEHMEQVEQG